MIKLYKTTEIPFKRRFWKLIEEGTKTTTIRTFKHQYNGICKVAGTDIRIRILGKRLINIPDDITEEVLRTEGFGTKEDMLRFFHRYKLPQTMLIYRFEKAL
jgi:hypothetical protein